MILAASAAPDAYAADQSIRSGAAIAISMDLSWPELANQLNGSWGICHPQHRIAADQLVYIMQPSDDGASCQDSAAGLSPYSSTGSEQQAFTVKDHVVDLHAATVMHGLPILCASSQHGWMT